MCLSTVDKEPKIKEGVGFKVGTILHSRTSFRTFDRASVLPISRWIKDKRKLPIFISNIDNIAYPAGFHIFLTEVDARRWKGTGLASIVRVKFKDAVATGVQKTYASGHISFCLIVARRICILKP